MASKPAEIESLLECCICLGDCQDPRLLPCAHSLCKRCLESHIQSSSQGGQFNCPACRHTCEVPPEGASGIPRNFFLNSLRDILQRQKGECPLPTRADEEATVQELECSNKDVETITHTSVTVYCVQCNKFFCSSCESFHKLFGTESHDLQPAEEVAATGGQTPKPRRQKPRCDQHAALNNDMYCETCRVLMCIQCCLVRHKEHRYHEVNDMAEETQTKLVELTVTAEKRYRILAEHLKKLDETKEAMDGDTEKASREISEAADELIDLVIKRKQALVQEIKDSHTVAATELNAAHKETEIYKATVQSLLSYVQALQTSGDVSDQVVHTPGLQEQLLQQEASPLKSVNWTVDYKRNTANVATVNALLGSVSKEQTVDMNTPVFVGDKKVKLGSPLLTLSPNIGNLCAGITKVADCVCVVGWAEPHLWMHNLEQNSSKQHTLTALSAVGMTTVGNNSNTLIITDCNKKLHFITIDPQNMSITKQLTKDISFVPRTIVYDHTTDKLVIANWSDKQIVICSKTGDIENRVTVQTQLDNMWCALPTAGDAYIVLDYTSPGRVHWVNQSGDVTHTYGADAGEHLSNPYHMLQDSQGRLLVADTHSHCIRLINNQQFSHDLISKSDGIQWPTCLYLDETAGTLYVGYYSNGHKLNLYKWPFTSADTADTLSKSFKLRLNLGRYQ